MRQNSLDRLHELAAFLSSAGNLNQHREELARHTAQATQAAACWISLLTEEEGGTPRLELYATTEAPSDKDSDSAQWTGAGASVAAWVLAHGKALLVADLQRSEFAALASEATGQGTSLIGMPITVNDAMIGVMALSKGVGESAFDKTQLMSASLAAVLIGKTIQVERLQTMLRSRIAQLTLVGQKGEVEQRLTAGTLPPSRLAKLLARSFYKSLDSAGFESGQIIEAASEIIAQITSDVGRFEKRLARKNK